MTTTELSVGGRQVLSFTVSGPWAHFRRIDSTVEKLTYRVIPRTTISGLLAAVLGEPRDSYYDTFAPDESAIAVTPQSSLATMPIPMLTLPTKKEDIQTADGITGKAIVSPETTGSERKRRTFEYIVDPAYRIDIVLNDTKTFDRLTEMLQAGRSTYTPSLGKSECLATIGDVEVTTVEERPDSEKVQSTVPEEYVVPTPGQPLRMERSPAYMTATDGGRCTNGFVSYAYAPNADSITVSGAPTAAVGNRVVCFI